MASKDFVDFHKSSSGTATKAVTIAPTANLIYVIIGGVGYSRNANGVTAVTVGGVSAPRHFTDPDGVQVGLDVYRLISPPTGALNVVATRAGGGYAPVVMMILSVIAADIATPDDGITRAGAGSVNGSPYVHTRSIPSADGDLTVSAMACTFSFATVEATAAFQTEDVDDADADGKKIVLGTRDGAVGSVVHSWDLDADAGGREAYSIAWNINAGTTGGGGPGEPGGSPAVPDDGRVLSECVGFEIWSDYQAAGGVRLAFIPDVTEAEERRVLMDADQLQLTIPADSIAAPHAQEWCVVRTVGIDESIDEWVITGRGDRHDARGAVVALTANGLVRKVTTMGVVTRTEANGKTTATFEALGLTVQKHWDTFLFPTLARHGYTWLVAGDMSPSVPVDIVYESSSVVDVVKRLAELTDTEWRFRLSEDRTQYLLDFIPQIASAAATLRVESGFNLQDLERQRITTEQANYVYVNGAQGGDGIHATMSGNLWRVTAVVGLVVTLADPAGGAGPVCMDDQWVTYTVKVTGGTPIAITDSSAGDQTVTLEAVTGISVGSVLTFCGPSGEDLLYCPAPAAFIAQAKGVISRVVERPDVPSTINLLPNADMRLYGGASGPPDNWFAVGAAAITRSEDEKFWRVGGHAARCQTTGDGQGLRSGAAAIAPTTTDPYFSGYISVWLVSGRIRIEMVSTDGIVTRVIPDGTQRRTWTDQQGTWVYDGADGLGVAGIDLRALNATGCYMRVVQDGAGTAEFYVEAAQLTQSAVQAPFINGTGPNQLMQEGNRQLQQRVQPGVRLDLQMIDLSAADQALWATKAIILGGPILADELALPVSATTRILEVVRNLKTRTLAKLTLSSRPEDYIDSQVRPRLPNRLPRNPNTEKVAAIDWSIIPVPGSPSQLQVRITSRPPGARIFYLIQDVGDVVPTVGAADYIAGPADGTDAIVPVNRIQADPLQFSSYCQLGGLFSPIRTWTVDRDSDPTVTVMATEPAAGTFRVAWVPDDDVTEVALYYRVDAANWPTLTGAFGATLDEQYLVGRINVREDGGSVARNGAPLANVLDAAGNVRTGIGGTAWQQTGLSTSSVGRVILVPRTRSGVIGARASASRTMAGTTSAGLASASQSALTDSAGGGLSSNEQIYGNVAWAVTAAVSDGTHDLRIYGRIDGGAWILISTITTPATTSSARVNAGARFRSQKYDPYAAFEFKLELIVTSGSVVVDTKVTNLQETTISAAV